MSGLTVVGIWRRLSYDILNQCTLRTRINRTHGVDLRINVQHPIDDSAYSVGFDSPVISAPAETIRGPQNLVWVDPNATGNEGQANSGRSGSYDDSYDGSE